MKITLLLFVAMGVLTGCIDTAVQKCQNQGLSAAVIRYYSPNDNYMGVVVKCIRIELPEMLK